MKYLLAIYKWNLKCRIHFRYTVLILLSILISNCGKNDTIPSTLIGVWKTETPQYEDRSIEINKYRLTFGTGEDTPNIYTIQRITHIRVNNADEYTFKCVNAENTKFRFIFYLKNDENGLSMRLNNPRQVIWTKDPDSKYIYAALP